MNNIMFFDSTLRDGSHAIRHQFTKEHIEQYCRFADNVGFYVIIVGHGNGLGASSLQIGLSLLDDVEMLSIARSNLSNTRLGAFLIPGFGTIKENLKPALDLGVDLVCIASHCTEADVTRQHIEYVKDNKKEAIGVLMMYHMASKEKILEEAQKMESYGASGVILMDSAGSSTPEMVKERVTLLSNNLRVPVGFHAHNNLGIAVSNSYLAIKSGALIIDGTVKGFGAGAGNCPLEVLAGLLNREEIISGLDLYKIMDLAEDVVTKMMPKPQDITSLSLISGISGVFSGFLPHVINASKKFDVDARDVFMELGKRRIVGGQEDMIVEVASELARKKSFDKSNYQIASLS
jgi:4-hydroxy 2-oxovalerate aldolase